MTARLRAFLAVLQLSLVSVTGGAEPAGAAVEVECPELPDSERVAALEARALLELSVRKQRGTLRVHCTETSVALAWVSETGDRTKLNLAALPNENLADRVILALDELTARPAAPEPSPNPAPLPAPAPKPAEFHAGLASGAAAEWWDGLEGTSLGLSLGAALRSSRYRGTLQGLAQRRVRSDENGLELWAYRGRLMLDYALFDSALRPELGTGVSAGWFRATAPAELSPRALSAFALALDYRLRLAWHSPRVTVALGPQASVHVVRPVVIVADREVESVSSWTIGGTLDVYFWF